MKIISDLSLKQKLMILIFVMLLVVYSVFLFCGSQSFFHDVNLSTISFIVISFLIISYISATISYKIILLPILEQSRDREQALLESKDRYRQLIFNVAQAIAAMDRNGKIFFINEATAQILGGKVEDFLNKTIWDIFPKEIADERFESAKKVMDSGQGHVFEINVRIKNDYRWFRLNTQPIRNSEEQVFSILNIATDITDRKLTELALIESEKTLNSIFRAAPVGIGLVMNRIIKKVNDRLCQITGYSKEELIDKSARMLYPTDEDYEFVGREKYDQIKRLGTGTVETRWKRKDGVIIDVLLSSTPFDPNDWDKGVTFSVLDITNRKEAELQLHNRISEITTLNTLSQKMNSILKMDQVIQIAIEGIKSLIVPDAVLLFLIEEKTLLLKHYQLSIVQFDIEQAKVHKIGECLCGLAITEKKALYSLNIHTDARCTLRECKEAGLHSFCALPLIVQENVIGVIGLASVQERDFAVHASFLETLANEVAVSLQNAILHEELLGNALLLEKRVKERTRELEISNNELKEFAFIISHDLKAPLRAVSQLACWLAQDYEDKIDKAGQEQFQLLIGRVKRMDQLINGILQYSRIGRSQDKNESIDLNDILPDIIDSLAPPEHIQIRIINRLPIIFRDRVRIVQLFQNLLSNAIKFMNKPQGEVIISSVDAGEYWQFSLSDNGPGIDDKYFDKIFQLFQTLQPRDELESTGIGLTLVKKIVDLYGGKIWVTSQVGKGAAFHFTIPK
jgi:PAS domain S-box-containing protein